MGYDLSLAFPFPVPATGKAATPDDLSIFLADDLCLADEQDERVSFNGLMHSRKPRQHDLTSERDARGGGKGTEKSRCALLRRRLRVLMCAVQSNLQYT